MSMSILVGRSMVKSFPTVSRSNVVAETISRTSVRNYHVSSILSKAVPKPKPMYKITFLKADGSEHPVEAEKGENLLDVVIRIDIDGFGACEGTLACSTCHLIFSEEDFNKIDEEATDEELDMLDLAFGLTDTSRLGCQVCMSKALDGVVVKVPEGVNDQS